MHVEEGWWAVAFILTVVALDLARLGVDGLADLADQLGRALVETGHGSLRIGRFPGGRYRRSQIVHVIVIIGCINWPVGCHSGGVDTLGWPKRNSHHRVPDCSGLPGGRTAMPPPPPGRQKHLFPRQKAQTSTMRLRLSETAA